MVAGFVSSIEDFYGDWGKPMTRHYGTKIIFNAKRVTTDKCKRVATYIRDQYGFEVECPFCLCMIIWEPIKTQTT